MNDAPLRVLASAILYRATLRALDHKPSAEEKMALHARVEHAAWDLPGSMLLAIEGRDVDDGIPDDPAWRALVERLAQPKP